MASDKQIAANRENAKKSTGPTSEAGKNKVRLNAIRDNLTGQITTLSDEDRPRFEELQAEMLADFAPQTSIERELAASVIWDTWRLHHLRAVEGAIYALGVAEEAAAAAASNEEAAQAEAEGEAESDHTNSATAIANAHTFLAEAPRFNTMSLYEQRMKPQSPPQPRHPPRNPKRTQTSLRSCRVTKSPSPVSASAGWRPQSSR